MLAHPGHEYRLGTADHPEAFDDVLREQRPILGGVAQRERGFPLGDLPAPRLIVPPVTCLLLATHHSDEIADDVLAVAHDRNVRDTVLGDLGRIDVRVDDLGACLLYT